MKKLRKGILITFEGIEGCGKSTHAKLLFDYLRGRGYPCVITREPGGTLLGERIRDVLLHSKGVRISDLAELFLFEAARSQIVEEVITPAISKNRIVISDRFSDATFCYQGGGGGVPAMVIKTLDRVATGGLSPDVTILLDIDAATGLKRAKQKGVDRIEKKKLPYHMRVRSGYLKRAKQYPNRIKIVKVAGSINATQSALRREVELVIQRYKKSV